MKPPETSVSMGGLVTQPMATQSQPRTFERQLQTAELTKSIDVSPDSKHLEFRVNGAEQFPFKAGQFVSIREMRPDGKWHTRAYSIASPPRSNATFDIVLNRV